MSAQPSIWKPPLGRLTFGLMLVVVATAFEALAVATILPTMSAELSGLALYGWTFSAFMLANLVGITLGGRQSDRVGPSRPFAIGTLLFVCGLAISGLAPSMAVIVGGRGLQGLGAGLLSAAAYASIALGYSVELQPRMLATLSSAWVVPGLVGPGLAGMIAEHAGWRWVFLGLCPLPLLASALVLPSLRALVPSGERAEGGRIWLALRLGLGVSAALAGLSAHSWELALLLLLCGLPLAVDALRRLMPRGTLLARPGLPAAIACMGLLNFAFFGTEAFLPLGLSRVRGAPVLLSGLALTAAALTWTVGAWLPVRVSGRIGRRALIVAGLGTLGIGLAGTLALLVPRVPAVSAIAAWGIAGLGMGLAFTTTSAAILEAATGGQAGRAAASLQLAQVLGAALATGLGGAIVAAPFAGDPPRVGIAVVDLLMLAALGFALVTARGVANRPSE